MAENVSLFLQALSPAIFQRLFAEPATCLSIFRMLTQLGQLYCMRLLFVDQSVPVSVLSAGFAFKRRSAVYTMWASRQHVNTLTLLKKLNILKSIGQDEVLMNEMFRRNLSAIISSQSCPSSFGIKGVPSEKDGDVSVDQLELYAVKQWESILHFMVGGVLQNNQKISESVMEVLEKAGLMAKIDSSISKLENNLHITNSGFQFLLQDLNSQLWSFLLQYADISEKLGRDIVDVLNFFFSIGALECAQCYSCEHFTPLQMSILQDLRDFGVVYMRKRSSKRFYPTSFARSLSSTAPQLDDTNTATDINNSDVSNMKYENFLVVETNYRIYAYTDSPLQISVLGLFAQLKCRFPNMVVGIVNRESIRKALDHGITAKQIVHYMQSHAHPLLKNKTTVIPSTIIDQIHLWELERNRLKTTQGYLYKDFSGVDEFQAVVQYAKELDVLIWESLDIPKKMMLFISADGHEAMKAFVKSYSRPQQ